MKIESARLSLLSTKLTKERAQPDINKYILPSQPSPRQASKDDCGGDVYEGIDEEGTLRESLDETGR